MPRRRLLAAAGAAGAVWALRPGAAVAALLAPTPRQSRGPYYEPLKPLSVDNDLVLGPGATAPAKGRVLHVMGRVLDRTGRPIEGARVEIWQANVHGDYTRPGEAGSGRGSDPNFQGFGHDATGADGGYRFRTIKPAAYGSAFWMRTPHIHFAVFPPRGPAWATQMYFAGEPLNERDSLLGQIAPGDRHRVVIAEAPPLGDMEPGSGRLVFDIVLDQPGTGRKPA